MSTEALRPDRSTGERAGLPSVLAQARTTVARALAAVCFWLAVALPLVYVPLLAAGVEPITDPGTLAVLLAANAAALIGGHGHAHRRE